MVTQYLFVATNRYRTVAYKEQANAIEGLKNGLTSGLAAACARTVLQLFDTMKTTVTQFSATRHSRFRDVSVLAP